MKKTKKKLPLVVIKNKETGKIVKSKSSFKDGVWDVEIGLNDGVLMEVSLVDHKNK